MKSLQLKMGDSVLKGGGGIFWEWSSKLWRFLGNSEMGDQKMAWLRAETHRNHPEASKNRREIPWGSRAMPLTDAGALFLPVAKMCWLLTPVVPMWLNHGSSLFAISEEQKGATVNRLSKIKTSWFYHHCFLFIVPGAFHQCKGCLVKFLDSIVWHLSL